MHHSSLFIINHHHSSPFIITQHPSSLFIIIHHHSSSFIITHHPASSLIIFIYYFIRYKLRHGTVLGDCRPQYNDIWELRCELRAPGIPYTMCTCRRQIPEEDARGGHRILALLRLPFPSVHRRGSLVHVGPLVAQHLRGNHAGNHAELPCEPNPISAFGLVSHPVPNVKEESMAALVSERPRHNRCCLSHLSAFCRGIPYEQFRRRGRRLLHLFHRHAGCVLHRSHLCSWAPACQPHPKALPSFHLPPQSGWRRFSTLAPFHDAC